MPGMQAPEPATSADASASSSAGPAAETVNEGNAEEWLDWIVEKMRGPMGKQILKSMVSDSRGDITDQDVAQAIKQLRSDPQSRKQMIGWLQQNFDKDMAMNSPKAERKARALCFAMSQQHLRALQLCRPLSS